LRDDVFSELGYWHQTAKGMHDNPPSKVTRSYKWSKLEDPQVSLG